MKIKVRTIYETHNVTLKKGELVEIGGKAKYLKKRCFVGIKIVNRDEIEVIVNPFKFKQVKIEK